MAIGPGNKITTTGLINKHPMIPEVPVMPKQQPTQAQVTPPVQQQQEDPRLIKYPGLQNLSDEEKESLNAALSPSVKTALGKIVPDLQSLIDQFGTNEPNVIFPLSIVKRYAMQRYGGQDENEAVQNFMADVISPDIEQAQMENQNTVPPDQPTNGLMTSPQNMETV